ncbi:hypothetical protein C8R44DRAFT_859315 [Mycena epipterygia]|nr:hypothetical protein C8R44DRAFT_859315 [Mycena epipterygia]
MSSYSFAPPGEDGADLWVERSNFDGNLVAGVGYGVLFTITVQTLILFLQLPWAKVPWGLVTYVSLMFTLASIGFAGNATFNQRVFIDDRDFPGGPNAFTGAYYSTWVNMMAFAAYIVMNWMASALVLWRFTMFWGNNYWLSLFPALMFLGSVASSLIFLLSIAIPTSPSLALLSRNFGIVYWSLSLSLNLLLSLSIATRILLIRRSITRAIGPQHSEQYVSIVAMLVESAAIYAVWGVFFLICFARNTALQNILVGMLGQVQGIAPVLIVFRVAQGRAWSQYTLHATAAERTSHSIAIGPFSLPSSDGDGLYSDGGSLLSDFRSGSLRGFRAGSLFRSERSDFGARSEKSDAGSLLLSERGGRSETGSLREGWGPDGWGARANVVGGLRRGKSEDGRVSLSVGVGGRGMGLGLGMGRERPVSFGVGGSTRQDEEDGEGRRWAEGTQPQPQRRSRSRSRSYTYFGWGPVAANARA